MEGINNKLGNDNPASFPYPKLIEDGNHSYIKLASGTDHTCGIDEDSFVQCFGADQYTGRLGRGGGGNSTASVILVGELE